MFLLIRWHITCVKKKILLHSYETYVCKHRATVTICVAVSKSRGLVYLWNKIDIEKISTEITKKRKSHATRHNLEPTMKYKCKLRDHQKSEACVNGRVVLIVDR